MIVNTTTITISRIVNSFIFQAFGRVVYFGDTVPLCMTLFWVNLTKNLSFQSFIDGYILSNASILDLVFVFHIFSILPFSHYVDYHLFHLLDGALYIHYFRVVKFQMD